MIAVAGISASRRRASGAISVGTVSFVNEGNPTFGTTSLSVPLPASRVAGNVMVMIVANKHPPNGGTSVPSGWSAFTNNQKDNTGLTAGAGAGNVRVTMWYKIITGSESGNVAVTMTGANVSAGWILQFSKSGGTWDFDGSTGADDTHDDNPSVIALSPSIDVRGGDMCVLGVGINYISGTAILGESIDLTIPGCTLGTIVGNTDSDGTGNDLRILHVYVPVSSGVSSGAGTYEHQILGNSAAVAVMLRLRALL